MTKSSSKRARWVAILTGALSVLIGAIYLGLITILDARGPLQPPPPEALLGAIDAAVGDENFAYPAMVQQPGWQPSSGNPVASPGAG